MRICVCVVDSLFRASAPVCTCVMCVRCRYNKAIAVACSMLEASTSFTVTDPRNAEQVRTFNAA